MPVETLEIDQVWQEADCLVDATRMEVMITELANIISEDYADKNPVVLCVMNGGLVFFSKLIMQMKIPLQCDYLHVSRYEHELVGGEIHWIVPPKFDLQTRNVLIVDDLVDEGKTLQEILLACDRQGAIDVRTAVMVNKIHDRKADPSFKPDYCGFDIEDRYLFGYGMDYKGYLRNADGIYAVKGL